MSNHVEFGNESSVEASGSKQRSQSQADGQYIVADEPELRATVDLEIQAKVDTNHPKARPDGMTLEGQEKHLARELEKQRTRQRVDHRQHSSRERRSRSVAARGSAERRRAFQVERSLVPSDRPEDPRELCTRRELAQINKQAVRVADSVDGWSRAAVARWIAAKVVDGADVQTAVLDVVEDSRQAPGTVIPIAAVSEVDRECVSIEGRVVHLWNASSPKISQVGLLEDDSGRMKFTSWRKSHAPVVREGERVVLRQVVKNWYQGRCSVALRCQSRVVFSDPERRLDG